MVSFSYFLLLSLFLRKEELRGLGPSTSIPLGQSAPSLPYFEHEVPPLLWSGVTVSRGTSSAASALAV